MWDIFSKFFMLGWVSFGGPAAHIGYFRNTFVVKHKWLTEQQYGQFVALSQFLPGPGSSQVGFSIGYHKAGLAGASMAFLGFTLPSVFLMIAIAMLSTTLTDNSTFIAAVHGLKLLAVVVVVDATWGMFNNFCKQKTSIVIAIFTAISLLIVPTLWTQVVVFVLAAIIGRYYLVNKDLSKTESPPFVVLKKAINWIPLVIFLSLLLILPLFSQQSALGALFTDFFQAGSLIFGGGHVVLPLLETLVGDQLSQDVFLTGYAIAQAVPGPMFTFATFLGFELLPNTPILGSILATIAVFLPGFLLLLVVLKNWQKIANISALSAAMMGVNAAVVGVLFSALYQPVFQSAVSNGIDMALVVLGLYLLKGLKLPIVVMLSFYLITGIGLTFI
jgi:chromate transporter